MNCASVGLDVSQTLSPKQAGNLLPTSPFAASARAKEVLVVFLMSLAFLLFNISTPKYPVFDEQVYISGGEAILHGQLDSNPEHPPLGKYLIGAGILMAGDNPIGWRVMPAIFGSLLMSVAFLWMSKQGRYVAWTAVALIACNGFWFVMSRLAMLSIFEITFTVIGLYLLTERRYWLCGAAIGLAAACRWNALFAVLLAVAFAAYHDGRASAIKTWIASTVAYTLAWLPLVGVHFVRFLRAQLYILTFHLHVAGNPTIKDPWYHWPFHTVPAACMNQLLANPLVSLLGVVGIVILLRRGHIVALAGIVFMLQWAVTPRILYYYYYLDTIVMMSLAAAIVVGRYTVTIRKQEIRLCVPVGLLSAAWFMAHYAAFTVLESPYDTLFQF